MVSQLASWFCNGPSTILTQESVAGRPISLRLFGRGPRAGGRQQGLRIVAGMRREFISQAQRNAEMEEEAKKVDVSPHKLLQKGEDGTMQGVIKDVMPVGYFITLPTGREGYLPALDLGITGGIVILEKLFNVGQEVTVRVVRKGSRGREILSIKKPEFAPNTDPMQIFQERWGKAQDR